LLIYPIFVINLVNNSFSLSTDGLEKVQKLLEWKFFFAPLWVQAPG